jgi:hypothetical protein
MPTPRLSLPRPLTIAFAIVSAAFVGWLAAAPSTSLPVGEPPQSDVPDQMKAAGALFDDIARLRQRLGRMPAVGDVTRNPFRFGADHHEAPPLVPGPRAAGESESMRRGDLFDEPALPFSLVGMAEEPVVDGQAPLRTAIVAGAGEVFLVREGDELGGQYRVVRVDADAIELAREGDGPAIKLSLK